MLKDFTLKNFFRGAERLTAPCHPVSSPHLTFSFPTPTHPFRSLHPPTHTVHFCWFIFFTMFCGFWVSVLDDIPYLDAWFSACAAMTGGSLMPYDVSTLSRSSEVVLWFAMTFGGITLLSGGPGLWRMYLWRKQLRPLLYNIDELRERLAADGADLTRPDVKAWLGDHNFYKARPALCATQAELQRRRTESAF